MVGRSKGTLEATAKNVESISPSLPVLVHTANVSSETDVKTLYEEVKAKFGKADALVNCAGSMGGGMIGDVEPSAWWQDVVRIIEGPKCVSIENSDMIIPQESNLKGSYLMIHYFIKTFGSKGTIINIVSLGASFTMPGISSYSTSKMGVIKLGEYLDAEHPELRVFSVHPGIVAASEGRGMVNEAFTPFAKDPTILTGALTTYLATPRADYARGGFISVNCKARALIWFWRCTYCVLGDVNELELHKEEIEEKKLLKLAFLNGKLGPDGHPWGA